MQADLAEAGLDIGEQDDHRVVVGQQDVEGGEASVAPVMETYWVPRYLTDEPSIAVARARNRAGFIWHGRVRREHRPQRVGAQQAGRGKRRVPARHVARRGPDVAGSLADGVQLERRRRLLARVPLRLLRWPQR